MNSVWKGAIFTVCLLLVLCAAAGCMDKNAGPKFETAYIYNEYGKMVDKTECLVDGDPTSELLARVEIKSNSARSSKATYTDLTTAWGLGIPALSDLDENCVVYTVDKVPVIKVVDWGAVYYVIPAQSEDAAWEIYGNFMHSLAESMGIHEE